MGNQMSDKFFIYHFLFSAINYFLIFDTIPRRLRNLLSG